MSPPGVVGGSSRTLWVAAVLLAMTAALWVPFGVHGTPQGDGWILKDRVSSGDRWFFSENPTRILTFVPWTLADLVTPDSFVGVQLLLILLIAGKALLLFEIVRRLPGSHDGLASLTAALSIVYPAGSAVFGIDESVDRHWAVVFLLLAVLLLLARWRRLGWPWLVVLWSTQALALWTNEAILLPALAVPLLARWVYGRTDPFWRRNTVMWLVVPLANALHNVVHHLTVAFAPATTGTQSRAVTVLAIGDGWTPMLTSMLLAAWRHLVDGWVRALGTLDGQLARLPIAAIVAVGTIALGLLLWPRGAILERRLLVGLIVVGLATIGLGFAPFALTELRWTIGRSFIISSPGAMILFPAAVATIGRRTRWARPIAVALIGGLAFVGASNALAHQATYHRGADTQDRIFAAIIGQAPRVEPDVFFAVKFTGEPPALRRSVGFHRRSNILRHALRYLYDEPRIGGGLISSKRFTAVSDSYQLGEFGVVGTLASGAVLPTVGYDRVLVFRVRRDLDVKLLYFLPRDVEVADPSTYRPRRLVDLDAPLPRRWRVVGRSGGT